MPFFRTGFIRSDIQISIKKDLNEEDLTTKSISYDQVPWGIRYRRFEWVSVDLPDIPVSIGETYYITVYTDGGFGKQFAWFGSYAWGASKNPESYVDGESWYSYVKGTSSTQWTIWDPPFDFCFQIFSNDS